MKLFIVIPLLLSTVLFADPLFRPVPESSADFSSLPSVAWSFQIRTSFYATPVVQNDVVYIGGLDSTFYALECANGTERWRFRTNGEIRSNVLLDGDRIFLNGGDGVLYALQKTNGKVIWKCSIGKEKKYDFADYFQSTPVLGEKVLYVGSGSGKLYAINADKGTIRWSFQTGNVVHTTPVIAHGKVFFGSFDGYLYALNSVTGSLVWKFKTVGHRYFPAGEVQGSPAVFGNLVFFGARDYNVYAVDSEKGFCHWNKAFTRGWGLCTAIDDSILYIGSSDERVLIAADPATGSELWKKKMEFLVFGNPVFSDTMLYIGTTIGKLHGISKSSGEKIWSFSTETYEQNRSKYFKPDDSYRDDIYSIIKSNEHFLEVECELGGIFSSPVLTHSGIFVSSTNGRLYFLK